jgi:hypothetical protein
MSVREIGEQCGVSHTAINKRAKSHDWQRDLKAKIRAAADEKVSRALVASEFPNGSPTETLRVEVEAEVQARIRLSHRTDIGRFRALAMQMATELDEMEDRLPVRTKALKDLTDVTKTLVGLEREAYGLEVAAPPPPDVFDLTDPVTKVEIARRLAFTFATARHAESRTTH